MTQQSDLPGVAPLEIKIDDHDHLFAVGEFYGVARAVERLEKVPESKQAPGFAYALALVEALQAKARADLMHRNLRLAAASGVNIAEQKQISLKGGSLVVTPYAPGEVES